MPPNKPTFRTEERRGPAPDGASLAEAEALLATLHLTGKNFRGMTAQLFLALAIVLEDSWKGDQAGIDRAIDGMPQVMRDVLADLRRQRSSLQIPPRT